MSTATAMRLVPADSAESAGSDLSPVSIATVVAPPLGRLSWQPDWLA